MENVKEMVLQVSILSLITGLIAAVKPYGKFDSQMKLVTSCIMLIGLLSPFFDCIKSIDTHYKYDSYVSENADELESYTDETVMQLAEEELEEVLKLKLAEEAVPCSRISVNMNTREDKSINIISVNAVSTKPEAAEKVLRDMLGEEVEIYAERNF
ncbi:MAG: stage III sporulation protein AF [Ruminococcus sp.]